MVLTQTQYKAVRTALIIFSVLWLGWHAAEARTYSYVGLGEFRSSFNENKFTAYGVVPLIVTWVIAWVVTKFITITPAKPDQPQP